jgi:peptidoglycan/xylan/chitin deacetylase (PgdA/CDA1 family)
MGKNSMSKYISLMYHAVYDGEEELIEIPNEERPYAVSVHSFRRQMQLIHESNSPVYCNNEDLVSSGEIGIQITFDDGDKGWYKHALPVLKEYGFNAIFFVTSDLIESRKDFCSWAEIRKLSDQGMSVQSHGKSHKFLCDLAPEECHKELRISKNRIEDVTGKTVDMISFPGGRFVPSTIDMGIQEGYRYFYTSKVGINNDRELKHNGLKRIAVRKSTRMNMYRQYISGKRFPIFGLALRASFKDGVRRIIGNENYHQLYRLLRR